MSNAAWQYVPSTFQTTAYSAANVLNQYVNITVGANPAATVAYDANGNLTSDGTWTFGYDAQNILRTATKAGMAASYAYDPLGRRQAKTVNAVVTTFLSDGDEEIADYAESGGSSTLLRRYVPGPGTDKPIAVVTPSGGVNMHAYFHTNRQGSVVATSGDNGTISEGPYTYDAYGNGAAVVGVPFKYTGRRLDPETGLYYYRARYYAPSIGRFLQTDPVGYGSGMNSYAYASHDPTNRNDPSGLTDVNNLTDPADNATLRKAGTDLDIPGFFTIGSHGSPAGHRGIRYPRLMTYGWRNVINPTQLAGIINGPNGAGKGEDVIIFACNWGRNGAFPTQLARDTGRKVWAPDKVVHWHTTGDEVRIFVAEYKNNDRNQGADFGRTGSFREYDGNGATGRRISEFRWNKETGEVTFTIKSDTPPTGSLIARRETVTITCQGDACEKK